MEEKDKDKEQKKKPLALNIVSGGVKHRGFGAGSIDLNNVSSLIIDGDECYLDMGALHAKSKVEKGIRFSPEKDTVPNGRTVWLIWVAVDRDAEGQFYGGITACEMLIDSEARRGWKILVEHVNRMDAAMKRKVMVENLGDKERKLLREELMSHEAIWAHTSDEVKAKLG